MCSKKTKISKWKQYIQEKDLFATIQKEEARIRLTRQNTINSINKKLEKTLTGNSTSLRIETDS